MPFPERIISCRSTSRLSVFREKVDSFNIQNDSVNDESQKQTFSFFHPLSLIDKSTSNGYQIL